MWLTRFALGRPVTVSMLFVCAITLGLAATRLLPLEMMPSVQFPGVFVQVSYPGSTPEEIQRQITRPLEDVLATIDNIQQMRSTSTASQSRIELNFGWDVDARIKGVEVREKIDMVRHELPSDVQRINVFTGSTGDQPLLQVRVASSADLADYWQVLDQQLVPRLERLPGVSRVDIQGLARRNYQVTLDAERMQAYRINTNELLSRLQASNTLHAAGELRDGQHNLRVTVNDQFASEEDIAGFVVSATGITLADIADIRLASAVLTTTRHLNGTPSVGLNVTREAEANLVAVADSVIRELDAISMEPGFSNIQLMVSQNSAEVVRQSLRDVATSGLYGFLLSTLVLLVFLRDIRLTLIVSLAVPFSLTITLAALYLLGISLNILSLMGLMLAIGMLVDNAVVVSESIFTQQEKAPGKPREAAFMGVKNVGVPVVAGTCTTAIVFLPNIIGQQADMTVFLSHVAVTIVVSLAASLFISTTMIPLLISRIRLRHTIHQPAQSRVFRAYRTCLRYLMDRPALATLYVLLLLASVLIPMQRVSMDQSMGGGDTDIRIFYNISGNYDLLRVREVVVRMEQFLLDNRETLDIDNIFTFYSGNSGQTTLTLVPAAQRQRTDAEIRRYIEENMPQFVIARPGFNRMGGGGGEFAVRLQGDDMAAMLALAEDLRAPLERIPGVTQAVSDILRGTEEVRIAIETERLQQLGLTADAVARTISTGLRQQQLPTFRADGRELDITVAMYQGVRQASYEDLIALPVALPDGRQVRLDTLASFEVHPALPEIRRTDRRTSLGIRLEYASEEITSQRLRFAVSEVMREYENRFPPGITWGFGESTLNFDMNLNIMLINMALAIMMIFVIMAALFESLMFPLAVVSSIVYGIVGVYWFFFVTGTSLTVMALIGMLVLIGVVVNNGIVLVARINQYRDQGLEKKEAVLQAVSDRVRPILMTAGTTIFGLTPLSLGDASIGGMGPPYFPMARAVIGGMIFSTIAALTSLPLIYLFLDWVREFYSTLWRKASLSTVRRVLTSR